MSDDFEKFYGLVDKIENESEMVIAFHLKNSFRLISCQDSEFDGGAGTIEFECINNYISENIISQEKVNEYIESNNITLDLENSINYDKEYVP